MSKRDDVTDFLHAYHETFTAETMLPYLRISGTHGYWSELDLQLTAAMGHRKTAQQALQDTAKAWEKITDRLGRETRIKEYRSAIGYKPKVE